MNLITEDQRQALLANGRTAAGGADVDPFPVVKLFTPDGNATWLLTELDPSNEDIAFGLCDLGIGSPELGSVSLQEIAEIRGAVGLSPERDRFFKAAAPISAYAELASRHGAIVTSGMR